MKICLNPKSSLQPNPLSPWERARERAANQRFAWAVFSTCRLLFDFLQLRFQLRRNSTSFRSSVFRRPFRFQCTGFVKALSALCKPTAYCPLPNPLPRGEGTGCRSLAVYRINLGADCHRSESLIQPLDACACSVPKGRLKTRFPKEVKFLRS